MKKLILTSALLLSFNVRASESQAPVAPAPTPQAPSAAPGAPASVPATQAAPTSERESYAGALLGAFIDTSSGGSNGFIFAGRAGTSLFGDRNGQFSIGVAVAHDSESKSVGVVTASGSDTFLLAELITRHAFGSGLYFGARLGVDLGSITISRGAVSYDASATAFAVGPALGYEVPILPGLAFDFDFSWMSVSSVTLTFPGVGSVQTNNSGAVTLMGGLTYHW